jgi:hypothetical protein
LQWGERRTTGREPTTAPASSQSGDASTHDRKRRTASGTDMALECKIRRFERILLSFLIRTGFPVVNPRRWEIPRQSTTEDNIRPAPLLTDAFRKM